MYKALATSLSAEQAHQMAIFALKYGHALIPPAPRHQNLEVDLGFGCPLPSPIGLAAGFDKDADALLGSQKLGFGAIEIGSVTPQAQPGNPKPRVFRLSQDAGVINRYGFNSEGIEAVIKKLVRLNNRNLTVPLGINLGKNKSGDALDDYRAGLSRLAPHADYITINLSSPNTPGLRDQQNLSAITTLIDALAPVWPTKKVLVKLAPDLEDHDLGDLVDYLASSRVDGVIMGNTTLTRPASLTSQHAEQPGGLSGAPLFDLALEKLRVVVTANQALPNSKRLLVVGCGGIDSSARALKMIRCGADMVQLYTAIAVHGPGLVRKINADLSAILRRENINNIRQLVGKDHH